MNLCTFCTQTVEEHFFHKVMYDALLHSSFQRDNIRMGDDLIVRTEVTKRMQKLGADCTSDVHNCI